VGIIALNGAVGELLGLLNGYSYVGGNPVNNVVGELIFAWKSSFSQRLSPSANALGRGVGFTTVVSECPQFRFVKMTKFRIRRQP
jgi:hypothetical protein